jgi:anti-sigma factor RsiW
MNNITPNHSEQSQFDQFELLSAYLDGEVSAAERQQVEGWLSQDPKLQQTYQQLLKLQNGFTAIPVEASALRADQIANTVFAQAKRSNRLWLGGIGAAAAMAVAAVSGLFMSQSWTMKTAREPAQVPQAQAKKPPVLSVMGDDSSALMIALERPPVDIPVVQNSNSHRRNFGSNF